MHSEQPPTCCYLLQWGDAGSALFTWDGGEQVAISDEAVQLAQAAHLRRQAGQLVARHPQLSQIRQRPNTCTTDRRLSTSLKRPCMFTACCPTPAAPADLSAPRCLHGRQEDYLLTTHLKRARSPSRLLTFSTLCMQPGMG